MLSIAFYISLCWNGPFLDWGKPVSKTASFHFQKLAELASATAEKAAQEETSEVSFWSSLR